MTTLNVDTRDLSNKIKLKEMRTTGKIPAVFYGFKKDSTPLIIDKKDFIKIFKEAGETSTITLKTQNGDFNAMIHEIQHHPITGEISHVDFLSVDMTKTIEVGVPLEFIGMSPAVKAGGTLVKVLHEIEVLALPNNIPQHLEVDISKLINNNDVVTLEDIKLPTGASFTNDDMTMVVASISVQEDEPETPTEINLDSIEVEKKGKKEEPEVSPE